MRTAGNIITTIGVTTLIFAGCCLESPEPYCYIMLALAVVGTIIVYLGYRLEEIADYICWNRARKNRQRRKRKKVKMWLGRAQKTI